MDREKDNQSKKLSERESIHEVPVFRSMSVAMDNFDRIMLNNRDWSASKLSLDPNYFNRLVAVQKPEYLWIGCSDSRVPAN